MAEWMAFSVDDYVSNTLHLTTRQHGGYILLICAAWKAKGVLPGTDAGLMAIAKLQPKEWKDDGPILKAFLTRRDDAWVHERVEFEWNDAKALIDAKSKAGKEGARKRWQGRANGTAMADPSQTQRQTDAPLPLPKEDISDPNGSARSSPGEGQERLPLEPVDAATVIFTQGLAWLRSRVAKPDGALRSILGKWRRDYGDAVLIEALGAAQRHGPIDPVEWITKALQERGGNAGRGGKPNHLEAFARGAMSAKPPTKGILDL